jgi:hypothetical protein
MTKYHLRQPGLTLLKASPFRFVSISFLFMIRASLVTKVYLIYPTDFEALRRRRRWRRRRQRDTRRH